MSIVLKPGEIPTTPSEQELFEQHIAYIFLIAVALFPVLFDLCSGFSWVEILGLSNAFEAS